MRNFMLLGEKVKVAEFSADKIIIKGQDGFWYLKNKSILELMQEVT